jgi:hypothetical protein
LEADDEIDRKNIADRRFGRRPTGNQIWWALKKPAAINRPKTKREKIGMTK